jgi:hypothetical protein
MWWAAELLLFLGRCRRAVNTSSGVVQPVQSSTRPAGNSERGRAATTHQTGYLAEMVKLRQGARAEIGTALASPCLRDSAPAPNTCARRISGPIVARTPAEAQILRSAGVLTHPARWRCDAGGLRAPDRQVEGLWWHGWFKSGRGIAGSRPRGVAKGTGTAEIRAKIGHRPVTYVGRRRTEVLPMPTRRAISD